MNETLKNNQESNNQTHPLEDAPSFEEHMKTVHTSENGMYMSEGKVNEYDFVTPDEIQSMSEEKEKMLDPRVESLAIPLARDYAEKNYPKREDGTFEPAWRGVNGEKAYKNKSPEDLMAEGMSEADARAAVIDIANQPYNEYSEYWKEQNRGGAEFLIKLIDEKGADTITGLDLQDEQTRSEYGDLIHENWLERNEWVKDPNYGDPALAKPFAELSVVEQQKDIDQLGVTQEWLKSQNQR